MEPPPAKSHLAEATKRKKKFCNTCNLHRTKATGHMKGAQCPYAGKMASEKGGDLIRGKRLKMSD